MRKLNPPTSVKVVKVCKPVVSVDGQWRAYDESLEHEDLFDPADLGEREPWRGWLLEAMGARMVCFFRATWSADGWIFRKRLRQWFYW